MQDINIVKQNQLLVPDIINNKTLHKKPLYVRTGYYV